MECFSHTLKTELVHHQHYETREEARRAIFAYIEGFYNLKRRHSREVEELHMPEDIRGSPTR